MGVLLTSVYPFHNFTKIILYKNKTSIKLDDKKGKMLFQSDVSNHIIMPQIVHNIQNICYESI